MTTARPVDPPTLEARGLFKSYGGIDAVAGMDLRLPHGSITGLIGPNGAGKSTLLNIVSGVERPGAGTLMLSERDVTGLPAHRLAALGLVRTFQICRDLGQLTVLENLLVARPRQTGEGVIGAVIRGRRVRDEEAAGIEEARALLARVDLWRLANEAAASLSGGQKKLLELCRALMLRPQVVLLDEPAAGVAPALRDVLVATVQSLAARGVTVLIVEHDLEVVAALCDHVYVMAAGRVLTEGAFHEVMRDRSVIDAYLGAGFGAGLGATA
jgi:ABC-type branched-subunit amino acid transport system ATPase component